MSNRPGAQQQLLTPRLNKWQAKSLLNQVRLKAGQVREHLGQPPVFMEVCGTHTAAIAHSGLRTLLTGLVEFRSGPGCPVCVTPREDVDYALALAQLPNITIATFGDLLRVPGSLSSLEKERARGAQVEIIYSPAQALQLAAAQPKQEVVLIAVGFETTAPLVALTLLVARQKKQANFSILSLHKLIPPALRTLLALPKHPIDGLLLPGHVATIIGCHPFDFLAQDYQLPAAVTGFEPVDILLGLYSLLQNLLDNDPRITNMYPRAVTKDGNARAQRVLKECFQVTTANWRALGKIPVSGLALSKQWQDYDAAHKFPLSVTGLPDPPDCACSHILQGLLNPPDCPLYGQTCTPRQPVGPCMVSSEGACAAHFRYQRYDS